MPAAHMQWQCTATRRADRCIATHRSRAAARRGMHTAALLLSLARLVAGSASATKPQKWTETTGIQW